MENRTSVFPRTSPALYKNHLRKIHDFKDLIVLTGDEISDIHYICLVPRCPSVEKFSLQTGNLYGNSAYDQHLTRDHALTTTASRLL
jgi:hypothetical protein